MMLGCLSSFLQALKLVDLLEQDWAAAVVVQIVRDEALPEARAFWSGHHDSVADF